MWVCKPLRRGVMWCARERVCVCVWHFSWQVEQNTCEINTRSNLPRKWNQYAWLTFRSSWFLNLPSFRLCSENMMMISLLWLTMTRSKLRHKTQRICTSPREKEEWREKGKKPKLIRRKPNQQIIRGAIKREQ